MIHIDYIHEGKIIPRTIVAQYGELIIATIRKRSGKCQAQIKIPVKNTEKIED